MFPMQNMATPSTFVPSADNRTYLNEMDKALLTSLVKEKSGFLESRDARAHVIIKKQKIWASLTEAFNASASHKRTVSQLKKCWANMKARAKKNRPLSRRSWIGIRGGPVIVPPRVEAEKILGTTNGDLLPPSPAAEGDENFLIVSSVQVDYSNESSLQETPSRTNDSNHRNPEDLTDESYEHTNNRTHALPDNQADNPTRDSSNGRERMGPAQKSNASRVSLAQGAVIELAKTRNEVIIEGLKRDEERKSQLHEIELKKKEMELEILHFQREHWKRLVDGTAQGKHEYPHVPL